jgi:hypothetical protein
MDALFYWESAARAIKSHDDGLYQESATSSSRQSFVPSPQGGMG